MDVKGYAANEMAARKIASAVLDLRRAWVTIEELDKNFPDAPVGTSWDTLRRTHREMGAMLKTWEKASETEK